MLRYYKLFDLLFRKNMKLSDLRKILSSATIAKLHKGEYISAEALDKICEFLNCQPDDVVEYYKVLNKDNDKQTLVAVKTIKEVNSYAEEVPCNIFVKSLVEPLNEKGMPVTGWYEKQLRDDYNEMDEWDKAEVDLENATLYSDLNKRIKEMYNTKDN